MKRLDLSVSGMAAGAPQALRIDFYLDLICPWCWIGLRNLRSAGASLQQRHPGLALQTVWHASSLQPQTPLQGIPYQAFYEARLGDKPAVELRRAQIRSVAETVNLRLNFEAIATFPNSALACSLLNHAQSQLAPEAMYDFVESLFNAFFAQAQDIGSAQTLQALALAAGVSWDENQAAVLSAFDGGEHIGGVPHLVFNQRLPATGAIAASELLALMEQILAAGAPFHG